MTYLPINRVKKRFNTGLYFLPIMLFMLYFFFAPLMIERLKQEIEHPTLSPYIVNFLNTGLNKEFLVYGIGFLAFLIFFWDFKSDRHFNVIGLIIAFIFIFSYTLGFTSILTFLIGTLLMFVSLV